MAQELCRIETGTEPRRGHLDLRLELTELATDREQIAILGGQQARSRGLQRRDQFVEPYAERRATGPIDRGEVVWQELVASVEIV